MNVGLWIFFLPSAIRMTTQFPLSRKPVVIFPDWLIVPRTGFYLPDVICRKVSADISWHLKGGTYIIDVMHFDTMDLRLIVCFSEIFIGTVTRMSSPGASQVSDFVTCWHSIYKDIVLFHRMSPVSRTGAEVPLPNVHPLARGSWRSRTKHAFVINNGTTSSSRKMVAITSSSEVAECECEREREDISLALF